MGITLTRKSVGNIAKAFASPRNLTYLQRLDTIAAALGFENQASMMSTLKAYEADDAPGIPDVSHLDEITASAHSDDYFIDVAIDARHFLSKATIGNLEELADIDWFGDYAADQIYHDAEAGGCPEAARLATYLGLNPTDPSGQTVGFEVSIDEDEVLAWLEKNRPETHAELVKIIGEDASPQP